MSYQNKTNEIIDDFRIEDLIGTGTYGSVYKACQISTQKYYAVKKIPKVFEEVTLAKRTFREIKILKMLKHENIISLQKLIKLRVDENDIYIVLDLMDTDLHRIIYSDQQLTEMHVKYFLYQIVCGLKYIHGAKIIHRDLKPSNILVNGNCSLKIGDFGMARSLKFLADGKVSNQDYLMTQYVATRWYRAPELVFNRNYSEKIDIWSLGCIFSEMVTRRPLFPSKNCIDSLKLIFSLVEFPSQDFCNSIMVPLVKQLLIESLKDKEISKLRKIHTCLNDSAFKLLNSLLFVDYEKRFNTQEILNHPFLENFYCDENVFTQNGSYDFSFDMELSLNDITNEDYLSKIKKALMKEFSGDYENMTSYEEISQDRFIPESSEINSLGHFIPELENNIEETAEKNLNVKDLLKKKVEKNLLSREKDTFKQAKKSKKKKNLLDTNNQIDLSKTDLTIKKNIKILPKTSETSQKISFARPALIVSQLPLVIINTQTVFINNTLTMENSLSNLCFDESTIPKNGISTELTVKTPKGTADGYSIGIDQDVLMAEVFNDPEILRNITDFPSFENINELNEILNNNNN